MIEAMLPALETQNVPPTHFLSYMAVGVFYVCLCQFRSREITYISFRLYRSKISRWLARQFPKKIKKKAA